MVNTNGPILERFQTIRFDKQIRASALYLLCAAAVHDAVALAIAALSGGGDCWLHGHISTMIGRQYHGANGRGATMSLAHLITVLPVIYAYVTPVAFGLQPIARGKETIFHQIFDLDGRICWPLDERRISFAFQFQATIGHVRDSQMRMGVAWFFCHCF